MTKTDQRPIHHRDAVLAHIMVDDAATAIDFYRRGFGATEVMRLAGPDGVVLHAELSIEGLVVMLGDVKDPFFAPSVLGGTTTALHAYVADVDTFLEQAVRAGATVLQPPQDMFYGSRSAIAQDPFGHIWVLLTHLEDLSIEDITRRGETLLAEATRS